MIGEVGEVEPVAVTPLLPAAAMADELRGGVWSFEGVAQLMIVVLRASDEAPIPGVRSAM